MTGLTPSAALREYAFWLERELADTYRVRAFREAAEVADVVAFLASPRSVAINGDAIACGGGIRGAIHY